MRTAPQGWLELTVASNHYWVREHAGVWSLLGLGPAQGGGVSGKRLEEILTAVSAPLHAVRFGEQVHGRVIATLSEEPHRPLDGVGSVGRCDGLMTDVVGVGVAVWTADCVPVLISGAGVVAAVHAGWRGAAAGIVLRAVRRFAVEYGVPADRLETVLGPAVSACHYEVGDEVISALSAADIDDDRWRRGRRVDLRDFLAAQLATVGVAGASIHRIGPCTACDSELASFRRDGDSAGRQVAVVGLSSRRRPRS